MERTWKEVYANDQKNKTYYYLNNLWWSQKRKIKHKFQGQASSHEVRFFGENRCICSGCLLSFWTEQRRNATAPRLHLANLPQSGYSLDCIRNAHTVLTFHTIGLFGGAGGVVFTLCTVRKVFRHFLGAVFRYWAKVSWSGCWTGGDEWTGELRTVFSRSVCQTRVERVRWAIH